MLVLVLVCMRGRACMHRIIIDLFSVRSQPKTNQPTVTPLHPCTSNTQVKVFPDALSDPRAEFVILASDGVWDLLTNEEAVRFVGQAVAEGDVAHVSQRCECRACIPMHACQNVATATATTD